MMLSEFCAGFSSPQCSWVNCSENCGACQTFAN